MNGWIIFNKTKLITGKIYFANQKMNDKNGLIGMYNSQITKKQRKTQPRKQDTKVLNYQPGGYEKTDAKTYLVGQR